MTKRAELAAAELARRGWDVGESTELMHCPRCMGEVHARNNYYPPQLLDRFKAMSKATGTTVSELIRRAMAEFLERK